MKRTAIVMLFMLLLSGCDTSIPESDSPPDEAKASSFEPVSSFPESVISEKKEEMPPTVAESIPPTGGNTSSVIPDEETSASEAVMEEPAEIPQAPTFSLSGGNEASEPTSKVVPATEPETENPKEAPNLPQTEPEQPFEISTYLEFVKCYGVEIGLRYDSAATACWDTPTEAHAGCIYLERDIRDCLDWYKASGFTAFCVWAEEDGDGGYNIYIGYA